MSADDDDNESDLNPYFDAANRLERVIDVQIETLNGIDDKAEHVTRLIGTVLTLVLAVLTLATRLNPNGRLGPIPVEVSLPFAIGVVLLLLAMAAAILTYVKSRFQIGMGKRSAGVLLTRDRVNIDDHLAGLIAIYGSIIPYNETVVEANANRFVWSLYFLLVGIVNLSVAAVIFLVPLSGLWAIATLGADLAAMLSIAWYTKERKYLRWSPKKGLKTNERFRPQRRKGRRAN